MHSCSQQPAFRCSELLQQQPDNDLCPAFEALQAQKSHSQTSGWQLAERLVTALTVSRAGAARGADRCATLSTWPSRPMTGCSRQGQISLPQPAVGSKELQHAGVRTCLSWCMQTKAMQPHNSRGAWRHLDVTVMVHADKGTAASSLAGLRY